MNTRDAAARAFDAVEGRNAASWARSNSQFYRTLRDPQFNERLWQYVVANRDAVNRTVAASPRLQEALAGRTLADLYREGTLGEVWGTEILHALEHPEKYGATDRREVEHFLGVDRQEVDALLTLRDAKDLSALAAEREAAEGGVDAEQRAQERLLDRIHAEYGIDLANGEVTSRDRVMEAFDKHSAKSGPALLRDYERLQAAVAAGTLSEAQMPKVQRTLGRMATALDRAAIRAALRSGRIDLATAQQYERSVNVRAMLQGELKPFAGTEQEQKAQLTYQQALEREAAAHGQLPEPVEHYFAEADGVTPRGLGALAPEVRRQIEQSMPSAVKGLTLEEQKAVRGRPRDAVRLAVAERMWRAGVRISVDGERQDRRIVNSQIGRT